MPSPNLKSDLGRHLFGLAAIVFGAAAFAFHDFNTWQQIRPLGNLPHREILLYLVAAIELLAGLAIQWTRTARPASLALAAVFFAFALLWVPLAVQHPLVYDAYGNFFEQYSLVSGALLVFASSPSRTPSRAPSCAHKIARFAYYSFALCVVSFTLEQIFFLSATASFVPKWIPPSQMFWAILTTVAFALAALALFSGRAALLAARLLTIMILAFGLLIWLPALVAAPHQLFNWAANAENLGIAASAWILCDYLLRARTPAANSAP